MFQAANRVKDIDSRASDALKQRKIIVPEFVPGTIPNLKEPIIIANSLDVGTDRVRVNHLDAAIHYFDEQEKLKAAKAPIQ